MVAGLEIGKYSYSWLFILFCNIAKLISLLGKFVSSVAYLMGISIELRGLENLNRGKGGVVVINHQSIPDVAVVAKLYQIIDRMICVATQDLRYKSPPFYLCTFLIGGILLNLRKTETAKVLINNQIDDIMNKNAKLVVFPEGTRNESDTLNPFKKGPFHVAIASQSCIQPIVASKYHYFDSKKKIFGRGRTIVKIFPEISTIGMTKADIDGLLDRTRNLMQKEFTELSNENRNYN